MANLFQKIKDSVVGAYHQLAQNDGGQNYRSYVDEQEKKRRQQQQEAARRAQEQLAQRQQQQAQKAIAERNRPTPAQQTPQATQRPGLTDPFKLAPTQPTVKIPQVSQPVVVQPKPTVVQPPKPNGIMIAGNQPQPNKMLDPFVTPQQKEAQRKAAEAERFKQLSKDPRFAAAFAQINKKVPDVADYYATDARNLRAEILKGDQANPEHVAGLIRSLRNREAELNRTQDDLSKPANLISRVGTIRSGIRSNKEIKQIADEAGLTDDEVKLYIDANNKGYKEKNVLQKTGDFVGGMVDGVTKIVQKPVVSLTLADRNGDTYKSLLNGLSIDDADYKAGKISKARLERSLKEKFGDDISNEWKVTDQGIMRKTKGDQFVSFAQDFAGSGVDAASVIPVAGGVKAGVAETGKAIAKEEAKKVFVDNLKKSAIENAKQAPIFGTADTANDAIQGRDINAGTLALNYVAPVALGVGSEALTRGAGIGLKEAARRIPNADTIRNTVREGIDSIRIPNRESQAGGIQLAPETPTQRRPIATAAAEAEDAAARRASEALARGDDNAFNEAHAELERLKTSPILPIADHTTIAQRPQTVDQPRPTVERPIDTPVARQPIAEPEVTQPELKDTNVPQIDTPPEFKAPQSLTDRTQVLEEKMLTDPSAETEAALNEVKRETAARQAAVQNRSVTATPNQELVTDGFVSDQIDYKPAKELQVGTDSLDEVDPTAVQQYKEQIANGQPIDPVIVRTDENGVSHIQDGKHRYIAMQEMGIENIPTSEQIDRAAAKTAKRGFVSSVEANPNTLPEVKDAIKDISYDKITNKDTLEAADAAINADPEGAIDRAKNQAEYGTDIQAQSMRLIDRLQAAGRTSEAIEIIEATARRATEAGQATQILAAYNRLTPEGILAAAQREITNAQKLNPAKYKDLKITETQATKLRSMAEELQKLPEGSPERAKATRELLTEISKTVPTPGARKFVTLWKAGLLTGVKGAIGGNNVGNIASAIMRKIADAPATNIDQVLALMTGQRSKTFTLKGMLGGFGEGVKVGVKDFKNAGESQAIKLDYKKVNFGEGALGRAAQKYTDTVFNFYGASDRPYYYSALRNNLNDLARVEAKNAGLHGKAARDFIKETVAEPSDDILTRAVAAAEDATFQNKNALGAALSGAKRMAADKSATGEVATEILMPFTGVPSAIAKQVYEYSPAAGVVSTAKALIQASRKGFGQAEQRKLSEALGRSITGTGAMWIGSQLYSNGVMTLGYPSDPKERDLWESEGKTPYSILIDGKWRSMNYLGQIMSVMAIGGQVAEAAKQAPNDPFGAVAQGAMASGKAIIGSTPLQGLQGGIEAVTDPARMGEKFVNGTIGSIIPTIIKDLAVSLDTKQRQVNNPGDAVAARIPGIRNGLAIKQDIYGNDLERATTAIGSIIDPFKSSQSKTDPLSAEMRRLQSANLGISPPDVKEKMAFDGLDTQLTPEQVSVLKANTGKTVQKAWNDAINTDEYKALSDEEKKKALTNLSEDINAVEKYKYASENKLGQFSSDYTGEPKPLSSRQQALLDGAPIDPSNYTGGATGKLASNMSVNGRDVLKKVAALSAEKKTEYLKDPKNNYQYELSQFENDFKSGKLSEVEQYEKLQKLGSMKIKSNYSKEANELYGLSKKQLEDYTTKTGGVAQSVLDEVMAMDQQLADEGFISKVKFGGKGGSGSGGKGGGGKAKKASKIPKPTFGSFGLIQAPNSPRQTMQSVAADLQKAFADIKILQGLQVAPGSDSSDIKLSTI